jgi:hypothetical protein
MAYNVNYNPNDAGPWQYEARDTDYPGHTGLGETPEEALQQLRKRILGLDLQRARMHLREVSEEDLNLFIESIHMKPVWDED